LFGVSLQESGSTTYFINQIKIVGLIMSKNQKHKEDVARVYDIFAAMKEAIPEKSTREDVIEAAELLIVDAIMQTKVRGFGLASFQLKVLDDISKLCDAFQEKERMMEGE
jgi:hypothetical protein